MPPCQVRPWAARRAPAAARRRPIISQPFWPAYPTAERIARAPGLKPAVTAGIGSDHVGLDAAIARGITVAEVTRCNSISVAEHVVMMIPSLVRNYLPAHRTVLDGGWNIAAGTREILGGVAGWHGDPRGVPDRRGRRTGRHRRPLLLHPGLTRPVPSAPAAASGTEGIGRGRPGRLEHAR
ncbi:hypothetical protein GCM10009733_081140 [Nonomuraea maheshkhaliensis]|uniref:D-isomer specific 2-hydroxyacid dehydrogenase catalytic domain-containing protein n=1 Tax=Nonomuraea maheshkhaliensis TaxID=419590 RepID=A0ABP4SEK1_9ACTN